MIGLQQLIGGDTIHMIVVQRQRGNRLKYVVQKSSLLELGLLEERKGTFQITRWDRFAVR